MVGNLSSADCLSWCVNVIFLLYRFRFLRQAPVARSLLRGLSEEILGELEVHLFQRLSLVLASCLFSSKFPLDK